MDGRIVNNAAVYGDDRWNPSNAGDIHASDGSVFNNLAHSLAHGFTRRRGVGAPSTFNNAGN